MEQLFSNLSREFNSALGFFFPIGFGIPQFFQIVAMLAILLWALKIYKALTIIYMVLFASIIGYIIGGVAFETQGQQIILTIVMAIIFGLLAWPLFKFFFGLLCGIASSLVIVFLYNLFQTEIGGFGIFLIFITFFAGGIIGAALLERLIIFLYSFFAMVSIISFSFSFQSSSLSYIQSYTINGFRSLLFLLSVLLVSFFYLYFSYFYQLKGHYSEPESEITNLRKYYFYKFTRFFFGLMIFQLFSFLFLRFFRFNLFIDGTRIFGINLLSLPIIILLAPFYFQKFVDPEKNKNLHLCYIMIFYLFVMPLISVLTLYMFDVSLPLLNNLNAFYSSFFSGNFWVILLKFLFAVSFPLYVYKYMSQKSTKEAFFSKHKFFARPNNSKSPLNHQTTENRKITVIEYIDNFKNRATTFFDLMKVDNIAYEQYIRQTQSAFFSYNKKLDQALLIEIQNLNSGAGNVDNDGYTPAIKQILKEKQDLLNTLNTIISTKNVAYLKNLSEYLEKTQ